MDDSAPIRWSGYDREHIERGHDWFIALGIIALCAGLTSILLGNILFAILIAAAAFSLALIARTPPALHEFELSDDGIRVGDILHDWSEIVSFWVEEHDENPKLLVDTTKFLAPNLIIPLEGTDPSLVRAYLEERVEEIPMQEPMAHKILELFGL